MVIRERYLKLIRPFYEQELIKVLIGIRRSGKSVILKQIMDELKENYLLAHGHKVKSSSVYLAEASTYVKDNNDLLSIKPILIKCLTALEQVQNMSMGDNDLLGRIGDNLQNSLGLLNMLTGDLK